MPGKKLVGEVELKQAGKPSFEGDDSRRGGPGEQTWQARHGLSIDFQVDTGFLTRTGIRRIGAFAMYQIYPKSKFVQKIEPFYWSYHLLDTASNKIESFNLFTLRFQLPRSTQVSA